LDRTLSINNKKEDDDSTTAMKKRDSISLFISLVFLSYQLAICGVYIDPLTGSRMLFSFSFLAALMYCEFM
jgi:hypothetical protein